jgi:thymidylate synthase (FAD)
MYSDLLDLGVCKEQARAVLPLATFTQFIFTASLQAWWNFYRQRSDSHAQAEIRVYAEALDALIAPYFPVSWNAFKENAK